MATACDNCGRPLPSLRPRDLPLARRTYDALVALGGSVETQKELVDHLWREHRQAHGTTGRYVELLAGDGHVEVTYVHDGVLKKRIVAVERP